MEVLKEPSKRSNVYHRLICGMSIWDGLVSASMFMSTWPMPTNGEDEDNTVWYVASVDSIHTFDDIMIFLSYPIALI